MRFLNGRPSRNKLLIAPLSNRSLHISNHSNRTAWQNSNDGAQLPCSFFHPSRLTAFRARHITKLIAKHLEYIFPIGGVMKGFGRLQGFLFTFVFLSMLAPWSFSN